VDEFYKILKPTPIKLTLDLSVNMLREGTLQLILKWGQKWKTKDSGGFDRRGATGFPRLVQRALRDNPEKQSNVSVDVKYWPEGVRSRLATLGGRQPNPAKDGPRGKGSEG